MQAKDQPAAAPSPPPPLSTSTPEEPYSIFDKRQKALIVGIVSTAATFSGFASNIYFPALPTIAEDLDVSVELVNLTVTSYLIFQGIAPSLWGPVSDVWGRRIAYGCTFVVFLGACVGLAETKNYTTLIVLRCLQSTGSASTIAIGSGVIGDITTRVERGGFMGIFQAGLLVPVAVGPVIGGALAGSLGWKAIFWFLAIYSGVFLLLLTILLPETLRSVVANGSLSPSNPVARYTLSVYQKVTKVAWNPTAGPPPLAQRKHVNLLGPCRILTSKHAASIIVFLAIYYAIWQMSITAMSTLFKERYGLSEIQIGLTFIANGVGSMIGTIVSGQLLDKDYRRVKAEYEARSALELGDTASLSTTDPEEDFPLEKARLRLVPIFSITQCLSILLFGRTIQYPSRIHPHRPPHHLHLHHRLDRRLHAVRHNDVPRRHLPRPKRRREREPQSREVLVCGRRHELGDAVGGRHGGRVGVFDLRTCSGARVGACGHPMEIRRGVEEGGGEDEERCRGATWCEVTKAYLVYLYDVLFFVSIPMAIISDLECSALMFWHE